LQKKDLERDELTKGYPTESHAGGLHVPGGGYLYITPLEKVATYIPKEALDRLEKQT
jgi:hypothetical protein